jgi:hypothetical protein
VRRHLSLKPGALGSSPDVADLSVVGCVPGNPAHDEAPA